MFTAIKYLYLKTESKPILWLETRYFKFKRREIYETAVFTSHSILLGVELQEVWTFAKNIDKGRQGKGESVHFRTERLWPRHIASQALSFAIF